MGVNITTIAYLRVKKSSELGQMVVEAQGNINPWNLVIQSELIHHKNQPYEFSQLAGLWVKTGT